MPTRFILTGLMATSLMLCASGPTGAQQRTGPLADRIQGKIAAQREQIEAAARAKAEAEIAARMAPQIRLAQTALNFFGFDAGAVDGAMGPQTRAAMEDYQAYLGYPVTGKLTESEAQFLVGAYQKAEADSATVERVAAAHPDGIKGLLIIYRDALAGDPAATAPTFAAPQVAAATPCAALPADGAGGQAADPGTVLTLQFCAARDVVIAASEALVAGIAGTAPDQVRQQCLDFEPSLVTLLAALPTSSPPEVIEQAAAFVELTGQSPEALSGIAETCLGVGYGGDRPQLALGSAVLLTALERGSFAEFPGHHLALGLGMEPNRDLARAWFEIAATSVDAPDRAEALRATLAQLNVASGGSPAPGVPNVPTFSTGKTD